MWHPIRKIRRWWLESHKHEITVIEDGQVFHHWMCWCRWKS